MVFWFGKGVVEGISVRERKLKVGDGSFVRVEGREEV